MRNYGGKKAKKKGFFSLDESVRTSLEVKKILATGKDLLKNLIMTPKTPITTLDQALNAWGVNGFSAKELELYRTKRLTYGIVAGALFCFTLFLSFYNFFLGTFGIFSFVGYTLALLAISTQALIFFWQSDMLAGETFIPFVTYVCRQKWLFGFLVVCLLASNEYSAALALPEIPLPTKQIEISNDLSSQLLRSLIGENWDTYGIAADGSIGSLGVGMTTVLLPILEVLNSVALSFITIFAVYIYTFGTVQVAISGKWQDNQIFSTFWSPMRTVAAIALCTPLQSGLSALHHLILLAIALSISMANNISNEFLSYVGGDDSSMFKLATPVVPMGETSYPEFFMTLLGTVCIQKSLTNISDEKILDGKTKAPYKITYSTNTQYTSDALSIGFGGYMPDSAITITEKIETIEFLSRQKKILLPKIIVRLPIEELGRENGNTSVYTTEILNLYKGLSDIADKYIAKDIQERGNTAELKKDLLDVSQTYIDNINNHVIFLLSKDPNHGKTIQYLKDLLRGNSNYGFSKFGWMTLGVYPFIVTQAQDAVQTSATTKISVENIPKISDLQNFLTGGESEFAIVNKFYADVVRYAKEIASENEKINFGDIEEKGVLQGIVDFLMHIPGLSIADIAKDLKERNPFAVMFSKGEAIMTVGFLGMTAIGGASGVSSFLKAIDKPLSFFGANFLTDMATGVIDAWTPLLTMAFGMLLLFGASCCYLLPALPMLYWARAVISWAVSIIQTLMGAPFWAAAHILPEGIGFVGQHARRGYIMLLDLFMRPTLLCCSIIMSMILVQTITKILGIILEQWVTITRVAAGYSFLGYFILSLVFIYIIYTTIKWLFIEAIGNFPTKVIRWCGGTGMDEGMTDTTSSQRVISEKFKGMVDKMKPTSILK